MCITSASYMKKNVMAQQALIMTNQTNIPTAQQHDRT
jgi:hypothetical protein